MASPSSGLTPLGLSCSAQPLGIASTLITDIVQAATDGTLSQLCDRPDDTIYNIDTQSLFLAFDTELVRLSITVPGEDVVQGSALCRDVFQQILDECLVGQGVWGGQSFEDGVQYAITQVEGADSIVSELEYLILSQEPTPVASGVSTASGIASGYPIQSVIIPSYVVIPSGVPSGFPTATVIASGFPTNVPGYIVPSEVASGVVLTATATPDVWIPVPSSAWGQVPAEGEFNALVRVRRQSEREEAEEEKRPRVRWIIG